MPPATGAKLPEVGDVIDNQFKLLSLIGAGGFAVVFRAFDAIREIEVAVKTLRPEIAGQIELVQRFDREARIFVQLRHPNTATLEHVGSATFGEVELPYLVFELLRGLPLGEILLARAHLSERETAAVLVQVLDSLHEAHKAGIVHRDLKPNNIMLLAPEEQRGPMRADGYVWQRLGVPSPETEAWADVSEHAAKVLDFGLAKLLAIGGREVQKLTATGMIAGTPHFLSPEQVACLPDIDHRADLYTVSMLIYTLITGRRPYPGKNATQVALKHAKEPPPPLPEPLRGSQLEAVYLKGASKEPDRRFSTAAEMAWELRQVLDPALASRPRPLFEAVPKPSEGGGEEPPAPRKGWLARLFGKG